MTEMFERKLMVKALVGSHNYNLNTPNSDKDFKYFVAPTFEDLYKGKMFSGSATSETLDYSAHDVRKLAELLWKGNVNFLEVLFSQELSFDYSLKSVFLYPEYWACMNVPNFRNATYGMHLQKMGELFKGTSTTTALVEAFGYDTKQACHALRCLYVLEKFAMTGKMGEALWFEGERRETLLKVKRGGFSHGEFMALVGEWHEKNHAWVMEELKRLPALTCRKEELENLMFEVVKANLR